MISMTSDDDVKTRNESYVRLSEYKNKILSGKPQTVNRFALK